MVATPLRPLTLTAAGLAALLALTACSSPEPSRDVPSPSPVLTAPAPAPLVTPSPSPSPASSPDTQAPADFYRTGSQADTAYAQLIAEGRDADAALIARLAEQPVAVWMGDWQSQDTARATARTISAGAAEQGQIAVLVLYAIPGRDCGQYSAGGLPEDTYLAWIGAVAEGVAEGGGTTWIVLEPDAVPHWGDDCPHQGDRLGLLTGAAKLLDQAGADVFLDVGHSGWHSAAETARRISLVGTEHLRGFSSNVSNYNTTDQEREWGEQVAAATGLEFLVDTSRNGNGSDGQWCNPRGRAVGDVPALTGSSPMVATVWVKRPGESDGTCNGGPPAGQWWMEIALELARGA